MTLSYIVKRHQNGGFYIPGNAFYCQFSDWLVLNPTILQSIAKKYSR